MATSISIQRDKLMRFLDETGLGDELTGRLAKELDFRGQTDFYDLRMISEYDITYDAWNIRFIVSCLDKQTLSIQQRIPVEALRHYE